MNVDRPEPGGELNPAALSDPARASAARPAATVILVRGGAHALEVLLVQRNPIARFMGGYWVFPGGGVDAGDGDPGSERALRAAALRELREEAGITLAPAGADPGREPAATPAGGTQAAGVELVPFARWITPVALKRRFDTWFFLAAAPADVQPRPDGVEVVAFRFLAPAAALGAAAAGELALVFPTISQLRELATYASADELLERARGRELVAVQPRVVVENGVPRVLLT